MATPCSSRTFAVYNNGEPKVCKTRVALGVDEDVLLSHRE